MIKFLIGTIGNYKNSGTVFTCSRSSARYALKQVDICNAETIVELGPGTGPFTGEIMKNKNDFTKFFTIEVNEKFAKYINKKFPSIDTYHDSAENLSKYLGMNDIIKADLIISTLPWAIFEKDKQEKIIKEIKENLSENGEFITIGYQFFDKTRKGKNFKKVLKENFNQFRKTKVVMANLPPAFFYYCKK